MDKNYLGIDWGAAVIGVAIGSDETGLALPLTTLRNDIHLFENLKKIIEAEKITLVVVGLPSHVNRQNVEYPSEKFGHELEKKLKIEVIFQDEMFTTKLAQQNLIARGERHVSQHDDVEAAKIILQAWLDRVKE